MKSKKSLTLGALKSDSKITLSIVALFLLLMTGGRMEAQLVASSIPGINVPFGFDAEVVIDSLPDEPAQLAIAPNGDVIYASTCNSCPMRRIDVTNGVIVASSSSIGDPDGVAVRPDGSMYVGGNGSVTRLRSLEGTGTDTVYCTGYNNVNSLTVGQGSRLYVGLNAGTILEMTATNCAESIGSLGSVVLSGFGYHAGKDSLMAAKSNGEFYLVGTNAGSGNRLVANYGTFVGHPALNTGSAFTSGVYLVFPNLGTVNLVDPATGANSAVVTGLSQQPFGLVFESDGSMLVSERQSNRIIRIYKDPTLVPTVSEWGLILLFLLVLCIGSIALWKKKAAMTGHAV